MTLANFYATGSGAVAVRYVIAGLATQFVSDPAMELTTGDGRRRVACVPDGGKGFTFDERVNLPEARLEVGGNTIRLVETRDEAVSGVLRHGPDVVRWLASDVTDVATTLPLVGANGISASDVVYLNGEAILVGGVSTNNLTGCTRGYWDTIAQYHYSQSGRSLAYAVVTNRPYRIRGRRFLAYLYGEGDDLQGDGTLAWSGEVNSDPQWGTAGLSCTFQVASIATRMEQEIGGGLDQPKTVRGAYYDAFHPLSVDFWEVLDAGAGGTSTRNQAYFYGFAEDNAAFVGATDGSEADTLNELILATGESDLGTAQAAGDYNSTLRAVIDPLDPSKWTFEIVVGADIFLLQLQVVSAVDGATRLAGASSGSVSGVTAFVYANGAPVTDFVSGDLIYPVWDNLRPGARTIPRGTFGRVPPVGGLFSITGDPATYPDRRLHIGGEVPADATELAIEWASGDNLAIGVDSVDTGDDWLVTVRPPSGPGGSLTPESAQIYDSQNLPQITYMREIAVGSLDDFRDALVTESVEYANAGTAPFLPEEYVADWTSVIAEVTRGFPRLEQRIYALAEPVKLFDLLQAEFLLYSLFPVVEANGELGVRVLKLPNASEASVGTLAEEILEGGWATVGVDGQSLNSFILRRGYDPLEDAYRFRTIIVNDIPARALDGKVREVEIAPKSYTVLSDRAIDYELASELFLPRLTMFGFPYSVAEVEVDWRRFSWLLGDVVSLSLAHLPSYGSGTRGINNVGAIVVGRSFRVGEPRGKMRLLFSEALNLAGYSPTARVLSESNVSGNQWDLTINNSLYAPVDATGAVVANVDTFFEENDVVQIVEYDSSSPTVVEGTVDSSSGGVIRVTFDAAWTPGSDTWELQFRTYADVQTSQKRFAYIADATASLDGDEARVFAP